MRTFTLALVLATAACGGTPSTPPTPPADSEPTQLEPEPVAAESTGLNPKLAASVGAVLGEIANVPEERRAQLDRIAQHVSERRAAGETAKILFICTHNSRRSHMGQLWSAAAAAHFGIDGVQTFSGGTEATAFNPRAVAALQRAGFDIEAPGAEAENPRYAVRLGDSLPEQLAFSKRYMDPPNPTEGFVAVMTCSDADQACPFVEGAALRIAIPYVDPKVSDGTPEEAATYDERSQQIAREMLYLFSKVEA